MKPSSARKVVVPNPVPKMLASAPGEMRVREACGIRHAVGADRGKCRRQRANHVIARVGDVDLAVGIAQRRCAGKFSTAAVALPPSPL